MTYAHPEWFYAFILLPCILGWYSYRYWKKKVPSLLFSDTSVFEGIPGNRGAWYFFFLPLLEMIGLGLIIIALARPQLQNTVVERKAEGIDIVLVLDLSTSMLAEDLKPNRFEAAKRVASEFVEKRQTDRIGLVVFAGQSFTVCPPTLDYDLLKKLLFDVEMGVMEDGTAIGMGIATSINRLKESDAQSKVIIILTDGQNNAGEIDPVTAAELARQFGIRIYSIGAGTRGTAPYPFNDPIFGKRYQNVKVDIDEDMMTEVAELTGGRYFRATDTESLRDIYLTIDELERTKIDELIYTDYEDLYDTYLLYALLILLFSYGMSKTFLRLDLV